MKGLILAAGQGDRLAHLTEDLPKALVKVCGRELIRYQFDFLSHSAIKEIGVVLGYQSSLLAPFIKNLNLNVQLLKTPHFKKGSALGIQCATSFLDDDFLLMNVDHIYPKKILDLVLKQKQGITAACDFDRTLVEDDMKVKLDSKGHLKEIHKGLKNYDAGYIGMTFCPRSKLPSYWNGLEMAVSRLGPQASVEMILGELARNGEVIRIADTSGIRWLEVDTLEDLERAEATLQNNRNFLK